MSVFTTRVSTVGFREYRTILRSIFRTGGAVERGNFLQGVVRKVRCAYTRVDTLVT